MLTWNCKTPQSQSPNPKHTREASLDWGPVEGSLLVTHAGKISNLMVRIALDLWTVPVSSIACPSKGIPFSHSPCQEAVSKFQRGSHNKVLQILINRSECYTWISNELGLLKGLILVLNGHSNFFKRRKGSGDYRLLTQHAINTLSIILTRPSFLKEGLGTRLHVSTTTQQ